MTAARSLPGASGPSPSKPSPSPGLRAGRKHLARLGFFAALLVVACSDAESPSAPPGPSEMGRYDGSGKLLEGRRMQAALPNIVVVVLDTTRADSVESPNREPPPMPALTTFAARNTHFVDASACASWTAPSVTTLLTGLFPANHGVQGKFQASPLVPAVATLAEYLQSAGYTTAAFTGGGWVSEQMGLGQGFDKFESPWDFGDPGSKLARYLTSVQRDKPLFLLLHSYEAHDPYGVKRPPAGHDDPAQVERVNALVRRLQERLPTQDADLSVGDEARELFMLWRTVPLASQALNARFGRERLNKAMIGYLMEGLPKDPQRTEVEALLRTRYREGLAPIDTELSSILASIDDARFSGRTVTIVCSDHGEAFGEHGVVGHGRWLWDVLTRTILVIRDPGHLKTGAVRGSCGLVDVVPTVLDLCGLPKPETVDGHSILALATRTKKGTPIRAEDFRQVYENGKPGRTLRTVSVRTERSKWIAVWDPLTKTSEEQVFDLFADPAEAHPLPASAAAPFGPDFVAAIEKARAHVASFATRAPDEGEGKFSGD